VAVGPIEQKDNIDSGFARSSRGISFLIMYNPNVVNVIGLGQ